MIEEFKKISKNTLIYAFGIIIGKAIGFLLIPLYTHYLTPEDYGTLELLELTSWFIGCFVTMGIHNAVLRYYAFYETSIEKYQVISSASLFVLLAGGLITSFLVAFSKLFSNLIFGNLSYAFLFSVVFINLFIGIMLELGKTSLRAEGKALTFTVISMIYTLIAIGLNIYFIVVLKLGIKGILYSTFIVQIVVVTYLFIYYYPKTKFSFCKIKLKLILRYGIPFVPTGIFVFILNWADRYFLKAYTNLQVIGLYSLGYKLSMIVVMLGGFPFALFWNAYMFEVHKKQDAQKIYARVFTYYTLVLFSIALFIACLSRELVTIMADPSFLEAYLIIPLIAFSMALMPLDNILRVGMLTSNKTYYLPYIEGLSAAIHIGLNFWLIRQYGMMGAGISTLVSYFLRAVFTWFVSQRIYPIGYEYRKVALIALNSIALFLLSKAIHSESLLTLLILKTLLVCLFPVLLYLTDFFDGNEKFIIKSKLASVPRLIFKSFYNN